MSESAIINWTPENLPDQAGKVFLITGGNSGIGFEAAKILARKNGEIILACRNEEKAKTAQEEIQTKFPAAKISYLLMDLADLSTIKEASEVLHERCSKLDVLINNAGIMAIPRQETKDGFEMQLGTNHLGHFAFSAQVYDLVQKAKGRIVSVSSLAHKGGYIEFHDLMGLIKYKKWRAYCQSKLANILFTLELQRRLEKENQDVIAACCHPGYSATNLQRVGPTISGNKFEGLIMKISNATLAQSAVKGAWPTVCAAAAPEVIGGKYYGPSRIFEIYGKVKEAKIAKHAQSEEIGKKFWEVSEELTKITWNFNP